jgi:hypothetical protein
MPTNVISGFALGDTIDFANIAWTANEQMSFGLVKRASQELIAKLATLVICGPRWAMLRTLLRLRLFLCGHDFFTGRALKADRAHGARHQSDHIGVASPTYLCERFPTSSPEVRRLSLAPMQATCPSRRVDLAKGRKSVHARFRQ